MGGAAPGSLPADATEVFQEGLRIPPLRLTEEVRAMLLANTRTPWERRGDLDAQVGANRVGAARLAELLAAGTARTAPARDPSTPCSTTASAACGPPSPAVPDGTWRFADVVDSTGGGPDQQAPARVRWP